MYKYKPLAEGDIRVLELRPALKHSAPISCSLRHASLDSTAPTRVQFEALSYVWDAKSADVPIFCDGRLATVTENCEAALRRLRRKTRTRKLWIDSVCINQEDLLERNAQVKVMDAIYLFAERVLIWLGDRPTPLSVRICSKSLSALYHLRVPLKWIKISGDEIVFRRSCELCTRGLKPLGKSWDDSRWPTRVWTLQEQWFARDWVIIQGRHQLTQKITDETCSVVNWWELFPEASLWRARLNNYTNYESVVDSQPVAILEGVTRMDATDPRDRVFGICGLLKGTVALPEPDYRKSPDQLYVEVTVAVMESVGVQFICPLKPRTGRRSTLPTWVPNLEEKDMFNLHPHFRKFLATKYRASGDLLDKTSPSVSWPNDPSQCPSLLLEGHPLGRIKRLGGDLPEIWSDEAADKWLLSTFQLMLEAFSNSTYKVPNVLDALLSLIAPQLPDFYSKREITYPDSNNKDLYVLPYLGWLLRAGVDYKPHFADSAVYKSATNTPMLEVVGADLISDFAITPRFEQFVVSTTSYFAQDWNPAPLRKLFILDTGLVGLGYSPIGPDDVVTIVAGMPTPIALHPLEVGWEFMGATIVPGAMEGQFWHAAPKKSEIYEVK